VKCVFYVQNATAYKTSVQMA